ncbi:MAG TPA: response regulator [Bryobacteraceae bacterium]|jgi:FixJ family two-component response regulator
MGTEQLKSDDEAAPEWPRRRISIVDDDAAIREALKGLMRSARYPVDVFASAEEFLDRANMDEVACLILDIRLPGISGIQLRDRLKTDRRRIPIIFISAHADEVSRDKVLKNGAVELLSKPVRRESLFKAIQAAIAPKAE